ncbi:hypothetical protein [Hyphococcus lacteus]|uniref:Uncharacterized protein n=1 Tax=Hyphococcus lacteus TaxID=3143536 RepID=A0ABV3Z680_9PROT
MALSQRDGQKDLIIHFKALLPAVLAPILRELIIVSRAYNLATHLVGVEFSIRRLLGPAILFYTRALVSPTQISFSNRNLYDAGCQHDACGSTPLLVASPHLFFLPGALFEWAVAQGVFCRHQHAIFEGFARRTLSAVQYSQV